MDSIQVPARTSTEDSSTLAFDANTQHNVVPLENDVSRALEIALEHISLNNFIEDRPTLLRARLVCHSWRTTLSFSSKITSVTLHTLADLQLAAAYFPSTPHQRVPWSNVEESSVFPSLTTLKIPEHLSLQLGKADAPVQMLQCMKKPAILILETSPLTRDSSQLSKLLDLANVGFSLQLKWTAELKVLMQSTTTLTNLTSLTLPSISLTELREIESLSVLSRLSALQNLQLSNRLVYECVYDRLNLSHCFSVCAALTQLTRLDFIPTSASWEGRALNDLGVHLDEGALATFKRKFFPEGFCEVKCCWLEGSFAQGVLKLKQLGCSVTVDAFQESTAGCSTLLQRVLGHGINSPNLSVRLYALDLGRLSTGFLTEWSYSEDEKKQGFHIDFEGFQSSDQGQTEGKSRQPAADLESSTQSSATPVFLSHDGVQIAAREVTLSRLVCTGAELTNTAEHLPVLFPQLQSLHLCSDSGILPFLAYVCHLTKLTRLTLEPGNKSILLFPAPFSCWPSSLHELSISSDHLGVESLANLEHLTKLTQLTLGSSNKKRVFHPKLPPARLPVSLQKLSISLDHLGFVSLASLEQLTTLTVVSKCPEDGNMLDHLHSCQAPLLELSLHGLQVPSDLSVLANTFPNLETLSLELSDHVQQQTEPEISGHLGQNLGLEYLNISPLSTLSGLQSLALRLSNTAVMIGADALTNLAFLDVDNAYASLGVLSTLASITQLQHLKCWVHAMPWKSIPSADGEFLDRGVAPQHVLSKMGFFECQELMDPLCGKLSHTRVEMYVNGIQVHALQE